MRFFRLFILVVLAGILTLAGVLSTQANPVTVAIPSIQHPDRALAPQLSAGGPSARTIHLKSGIFIGAGEIGKNLARCRAGNSVAEKVHVLVQFEAIPDAAERERLKQIGVELLDYLPENTFFASVKREANPEQIQAGGLRWLGGIHPEDRIPPHFQADGIGSWATERDGFVALAVTCFADVDTETASDLAEAFGAIVMERASEFQRLILRVPAETIAKLAEQDWAQWIEEVPPPPVPDNHVSRSNVQAEALQSLFEKEKRTNRLI